MEVVLRSLFASFPVFDFMSCSTSNFPLCLIGVSGSTVLYFGILGSGSHQRSLKDFLYRDFLLKNLFSTKSLSYQSQVTVIVGYIPCEHLGMVLTSNL